MASLDKSVAQRYMRMALRLASRGFGQTSPNPMVGALLVKSGRIIGRGWHHRAGEPHAEIEALADARRRGTDIRGATLYVTLEPCCTHGRTPPCTDAIIDAGVRNVVIGGIDPNPAHSGKGLKLLKRAGVRVASGILESEAARLNEAFNHWIVERTPFVTVKAAMTLDGKVATSSGESKWITGQKSRAWAMHLRQASDAVLVGVNTVIADDPALTARLNGLVRGVKVPRRIILDSAGRTPGTAKVLLDRFAAKTTVVVTRKATRSRVHALRRCVNVLVAPDVDGRVNLRWLIKRLGQQGVTSLLVEGGGEVNSSFLLGGLAHRVAFFYAPKVLCGRDAIKAVAGEGISRRDAIIKLQQVEYRWFDGDLFMTACVSTKT